MEERNQPRRPRRDADEQPQSSQEREPDLRQKPRDRAAQERLRRGYRARWPRAWPRLWRPTTPHMAKEAGAAVKRVNPNKLRLMTGTESHQGVAAFASEIEYATVEDLLAGSQGQGRAARFWC